jgi:guanylate kinase
MGRIYVLLGPAGSGKTTTEKIIVSEFSLTRPRAVTDRDPRPGEDESKAYEFISTKEFISLRETGELVVFTVGYMGKLYGYRKADLDRALEKGDVLLLLNLEGFQQLERLYACQVAFFWVDKPTQFQRLADRRLSEEDIRSRMAGRTGEIQWALSRKFDMIDSVALSKEEMVQEAIKQLDLKAS